jgi:hypothetical protein
LPRGLPRSSQQSPDIVVAASGGAHYAGVLVHSFQELADNERHGLDPFHFLLGVEVFLLQVPLLILRNKPVNPSTRYPRRKI